MTSSARGGGRAVTDGPTAAAALGSWLGGLHAPNMPGPVSCALEVWVQAAAGGEGCTHARSRGAKLLVESLQTVAEWDGRAAG